MYAFITNGNSCGNLNCFCTVRWYENLNSRLKHLNEPITALTWFCLKHLKQHMKISLKRKNAIYLHGTLLVPTTLIRVCYVTIGVMDRQRIHN